MYLCVHALTCMYVEHLLSDITKCISLIMYIFPKSSNQIFLQGDLITFSLPENGTTNQDMNSMCAHYYWCVIAGSQVTK